MLLWIANRWREDRHRFTAEKRAVYTDFIRVQRDVKSQARDLIEITAQLEVQGPRPDRELGARAGRLSAELAQGDDKLKGAIAVLVLIAPPPVVGAICPFSTNHTPDELLTPEMDRALTNVVVKMRADLLGSRGALPW